MMGGSLIVRVCICQDYPPDSLELHIPPLLRPMCDFLPAITMQNAAGQGLFPMWSGKKVVSELRSFAQVKG